MLNLLGLITSGLFSPSLPSRLITAGPTVFCQQGTNPPQVGPTQQSKPAAQRNPIRGFLFSSIKEDQIF